MNKFLVVFGELTSFLAYIAIGFCIVVSWVGLIVVVAIVLKPKFPIVVPIITSSMAALYFIGLFFFTFKFLGNKKKEVSK